MTRLRFGALMLPRVYVSQVGLYANTAKVSMQVYPWFGQNICCIGRAVPKRIKFVRSYPTLPYQITGDMVH